MSSSQIDFPQVSVITPPAEKTQSKTILFPVDKKLVSTSRNERLSEKHVPVEEWTVSTGSSWLLSEKMKENGFD